MNKILVSACLAGFPCRYDGKSCPDEKVMELVKQGLAIPVCPEQLGGLPVPRPAAEIVGDRVLSEKGQDFTSAFTKGAEESLKIAQSFGGQKAILKAKSPSCGSGQIYDGTFTGQLRQGKGITAQLLSENGIEIVSI